MAFSGKGKYKGASWKVIPFGHHRLLRFGRWVFPYFVGERVKFKLKVEPTNQVKLNDFPIFVRYAESERIVQLKEPGKLPDSTKSIRLTGAIVSGEKTIEYWIGDPKYVDSQLIFGETGNYNDKVIIDILLGILMAAIGFVFGVVSS